jgi:hypothetical protein
MASLILTSIIKCPRRESLASVLPSKASVTFFNVTSSSFPSHVKGLKHLYITCVKIMCMSNVNMTIVLPRELKDKIRKLKNVNWSEVARKAFEEEIERIEKEQALEEIMRLREESKVEWEGAEVIRRWRNSH